MYTYLFWLFEKQFVSSKWSLAEHLKGPQMKPVYRSGGFISICGWGKGGGWERRRKVYAGESQGKQ